MTRPHLDCARSGNRGMSLIEVLVSILILSFGLLGLIGLQSRATAISASSEDSNRAALLGNDIVAALILNPTSSGQFDTSSTSVGTLAASAAASQVPNGVATISFDPTVKIATVVISWKSPNAASAATSNNYKTQAVLP